MWAFRCLLASSCPNINQHHHHNPQPPPGTIGTPAEAKNSITVGATTNNVADPDVAPFSSRGPTFDNRA